MSCQPCEIFAPVPVSAPVAAPAPDRLERPLFANDPRGSEISLVDLVLFACDASEDETEVADLVDGAISTGAARILPVDCDPMLARMEPLAVEAA
jgi:hypothetical protein